MNNIHPHMMLALLADCGYAAKEDFQRLGGLGWAWPGRAEKSGGWTELWGLWPPSGSVRQPELPC
jgi:hypothetical protein